MALKTPYATVLESNSYLSENDDWLDLSSSEKNVYLVNGRYFIDSNYAFYDEIDEDDVPDDVADELKYANSLLAEFDLATGIYNVSASGNAPVVSKKVKAGSVETETDYAGNRSSSLRIDGIDPYPAVTSILSEYCYRSKGSSLKTSSLLRA